MSVAIMSFLKKVWLNTMAHSNKKVKQKESPRRDFGSEKDPDSFYRESPAWNFNTCDPKMWCFDMHTVGNRFWNDVFPKLQEFERLTWNDMLIRNKKSHHSLNPKSLNKIAKDRLEALRIELDAVISLRIDGTTRIYGFTIGRVFNIIWFDQEHGDNDTCVCRSQKKHT